MKWANKQSGFTIVELLIVIVVIAILAAITIVAYNGIQGRAQETSVRSDLAQIAKRAAAYNVDKSIFPASSSDFSGAYAVRVNTAMYDTSAVQYNVLYCTSAPTNYALVAMAKSGKRFFVTHEGSVSEYTGTTSWNTGATPATICSSVLPGSTNAGNTGFRADSTPQWRAWVQ